MLDFILLAIDNPLYKVESDARKKSMAFRPLGPYKISWITREHGYKSLTVSHVQLLEEQEAIDLISPLIDKKTVIGVSTSLIQPPLDILISKKYNVNDNTRELFKLRNIVNALRSKYNNKVVVGGAVGKIFHDFFNADESFSGGAENQIVHYLDQLFRMGIQRKPYDWDIQNCNFRWHESDIVQNKEVLPIEMSRGCMFKCKFCAWELIGKKRGTYERSIKSLKEEILYNYDTYNCSSYVLASDTINEDTERMHEWCDMLESLPFKIRYTGFARLDLAYRNLDLTRRMYETGLVGVHFGIETFNYEAARSIGKGFNGKYGKDALEHIFYNIFEENVAVNCTMIIGLPFESIDSIYHNVEWFKQHDKIHARFHPLQLSNPELMPDHFTLSEFSKNVMDYGFIFDQGKINDWKSDIMSWQDALRIAYDIRNNHTKNNTLESWSGIVYLTKLDKTPKYFFENNAKNLISDLFSKIEQDNENYFKSLRDYIQKHILNH